MAKVRDIPTGFWVFGGGQWQKLVTSPQGFGFWRWTMAKIGDIPTGFWVLEVDNGKKTWPVVGKMEGKMIGKKFLLLFTSGRFHDINFGTWNHE